MLDVTFDFSAITAAEMADFGDANRQQDYDKMAAVFARAITTCPAEWGDPQKPETYTELHFLDTFWPLIEQFLAAANAPNGTFDESAVDFDLRRVKAKDMTRFFAANRTYDYRTVAVVMFPTITRCPVPAPDAEGLLRLHFASQFIPLVRAFGNRLTEDLKNAKRRSSTS